MKRRTLRPDAAILELFLYRHPVDFRKSYRGLSAIVEQELGHDPFSGTLYAFVNRDRERVSLCSSPIRCQVV